MKPLHLLSSILLVPLSSAQLLPAQAPLPPHPPPAHLPVMPRPPQDDTPTQPAVPLTDILGTNRALTTFSSLTRMHSSTSSLLGDMGTNTTVLAPLNSAMDALPRKPWEDPGEYRALGERAYEGGEGEDRAKENLRRFVEAHLVVGSPWEEGVKAQTIGGRELWWEMKDGERRIFPDEVLVEKVASQVANGEVVSLVCSAVISSGADTE